MKYIRYELDQCVAVTDIVSFLIEYFGIVRSTAYLWIKQERYVNKADH